MAVKDGLSFKRFYIENQTRLDLSYSQFSRILHTLKIDYELEPEKPQAATAITKVATNEKTQPQRAEPLFVETEKARTFNWDPVACYSKKYD